MLGRLRIEAKLLAGTRKDEDAGVFVAYCPALRLYSQGRDEAEAERALNSAVVLYLKHCYRRSILDNILNRLGFTDADPGDDTAPGGGEHIVIDEFPHQFEIDIHPLDLFAGKPVAEKRCP